MLVSLPTTLPSSFPHAVALGCFTLHDGGIADLVDLELDTGWWLRARLAPHLLRLGDQLVGRWMVTFHFRTDASGQVQERPRVIRLVPADNTHDVPLSWSATGKLIEVNRTADLVRLRIIPPHTRVKPFIITAHAPPHVLDGLQTTDMTHFTGSLQGNVLVAETSVAYSLSVQEPAL